MSKSKMHDNNPSQRNEAQNNRGDHEKNLPKKSDPSSKPKAVDLFDKPSVRR
jgi:hypothetical protein